MAKIDTVKSIAEKFDRDPLNVDDFNARTLDALLACETPEAYDTMLVSLRGEDPAKHQDPVDAPPAEATTEAPAAEPTPEVPAAEVAPTVEVIPEVPPAEPPPAPEPDPVEPPPAEQAGVSVADAVADIKAQAEQVAEAEPVLSTLPGYGTPEPVFDGPLKEGDPVVFVAEDGTHMPATFVAYHVEDGVQGVVASLDIGHAFVATGFAPLAQVTTPEAVLAAQPSQPQENAVTKTETPAPTDETPETIEVRVNYEDAKLMLAEGTAYIHPTTKQLISGSDLVEVPDDAWTQELIGNRYLTTKAKR